MPLVQLAEATLNQVIEGPDEAPVLVLSNSLGTDLHMWDAQMPVLTEHFRVLRYDTRGHGQSSVPAGPYRIEQLAGDVLQLLDALDIQRVHFCGLSLGGLTGQWLAIHAPQRIDRLVLCNTATRIAGPDIWNPRIEAVLNGGASAMQALAVASAARWFTPSFRERQAAVVARICAMLEATSAEGYAACCAAVRDADFRGQLAGIEAPTLVVCGDADPVTQVRDGQQLQEAIADALLTILPAAHLSNVEAGPAFSARLLSFLQADLVAAG